MTNVAICALIALAETSAVAAFGAFVVRASGGMSDESFVRFYVGGSACFGAFLLSGLAVMIFDAMRHD